MTRAYRGIGGGGGVVEVVEDGAVTGLLRHHVRHSPTGFAWGYGGSGPAELARCLLIDALGDEARCWTCIGTGHQRYAGNGDTMACLATDPEAVICFECSGSGFGRAVEALYQDLKWEVVAKLPQDEGWKLSALALQTWVAERTQAAP